MPDMYEKHPDYRGKDLTLHVGNGDKRVLDGDILEGQRWVRFAQQGFLRRLTDEEVDKVLAAREGREQARQARQEAQEPQETASSSKSGGEKEKKSESGSEDGTTKSPASKYDPDAEASSTSTKKSSKKKKKSDADEG